MDYFRNRELNYNNMMAQSKISDSEMQYYQFKARQKFLLQKEDYEWQLFCLQKVSNCSTCKSGCGGSSKDVGSQTLMKRTPFNVGKNYSSESRVQPAQLDVDLNFIKSKLDRIDVMLSELKLSESDETHEKTRLGASSSNLINSEASAMDNLDARRRQIIQNSLKESLKRLHASAMGVPKTSTSKIQPKNSGYFLPHNLQVQRETARRSYLLSLSKPRLINLVEKNKKNSSTSAIQAKLSNFSTTSRNRQPNSFQRKKVLKKPGAVKFRKKMDVSTQVDLVEQPTDRKDNLKEQSSEYKDENIECAVDGILTDLLGETVLSLNAIKQRKSKQLLSKTVFEEENTHQKFVKGEDRICALHSSDINRTAFKNEDKRCVGEKSEHLVPESNVGLGNSIVDINQTCQEPSDEKRQTIQAQKQTAPKTLLISADSLRKIAKYRKQFWNYLEATSSIANENFNPWALADMIAEAILEDCITDVCQDIGDLPSAFIDELYRQEFVQHM